ncbi:MAG: peptidase M23 [Acidobacteria bacterium]|nr:MAG: peptidase M23 [Acidobacteriota bacterium]
MRAFQFLLSLLALFTLVAASPKKDWKDVEAALGRAGTVQPDGAYKVSFPRSDLTITVDGVGIKPALALGSWAAFNESGAHATTMGDLVLLESEVNPVIAELQKGGIEATAIHNHLIGESPRVMYVHFSGHGDATAIARTLHSALALTKTPMGPPAAPAAAQLDLPTADLDRIVGHPGKANGGVYQFGVPRADKTTEHGMTIPASMGLATAINFQPTGNGRAAITGDFVLIASEVNPVIRELQSGGIAVTALHSHMLDEQPRLFFMHFWANDDALKLARTLRSALDRMHIKK